MMETRKQVIELNIDDVLPNRFQPRIKFNEDAINELSKLQAIIRAQHAAPTIMLRGFVFISNHLFGL